MEPLDESANVLALLDETERRAKSDFTDNIVYQVSVWVRKARAFSRELGDLHCPPSKVKGSASPDIKLTESTLPVSNARVHQGLHSLHVGEAVLCSPLACSQEVPV